MNTRIAFIAALSLAGMAATPVTAQSAARQTAELAAPAKTAKVIGKGVVWHCAGTSCNAPQSDSRAAISCATLVKQVGQVSAFTVGGVALDEAALTRCNSFARN